MESATELWARAQRAESEGGRREARALYEQILETEPHHVPARLRMSRLDQFADAYRDSKAHVTIAAEACEVHRSVRNIAYVTARLLEFAEEERVARIIMSVDWSDPHVIRQSPSLAQHLWLTGRYEDTLRFLDEMDKRAGRHPLLIFTRANVLRYLGDMERAEQQYEACIEVAPGFADAHLALATHSRARPARARVTRIRDALSQAPAGGLQQAQLWYALFHELDAADDCDAAWEALGRGMEIMRRHVAFDPQQQAARLREWLQVTPPARETDPGEIVPIFVVGMPRTGTTLLDRMLSNHSKITSAGERNDFAAAVSEVSGRFYWSATQREAGDLPTRIELDKVRQLYLQRLHTRAQGARFVIDKNPQNLFNLPLILAAIPQARVLCLLRNSMDACFSNLKEMFHGGAYPYSYAMEDVAAHCLHAMHWIEHWQRIAPHAVGIVAYENLVLHSESSIAGVVRFLGLEAEENLHDITRNDAPVSTASSSQVRQAVHSRAVEAWRRYESHLQPLRKSLGA